MMPSNLGLKTAPIGTFGVDCETMTTIVEKSIRQRFRGYDVIAKIIADLYDRMASDPHTWYYWKCCGTEDKATECQQFTYLVGAPEGGPVISQHRDVKSSFKPLGIGKVEWQHFVTLTAKTLDQYGLTDGEKEQLYSLLTRAKAKLTVDGLSPPHVGGFAAFPHQLTQREREVLRLVALGKNNPEIATELIISVNTVTRHITNIFAKTSTRNRVEAAVYAARRHLV